MGYHEVEGAAPLPARDFPPSPPSTCAAPLWSRIPGQCVINAAYDHTVEWVKHNVAPPIGNDIDVAKFDVQSELVRDEFGNALGGVRLSQHAVATAINTGLNGPAATPCRWFGSYVAFDQATLGALYPDHQAYLNLVMAATHETQKAGFIIGADAAAAVRDAARSDIGRRATGDQAFLRRCCERRCVNTATFRP